MRFLADMGLDVRVVEWLRAQGHDATHLREEGLQRLPDSQIFAKAIAENRVLLAFDLDFGEIVVLSTSRPVGVVLFRLQNARTTHVIARLSAILPEAIEPLERGALVVVEEGRYRIREPLSKP